VDEPVNARTARRGYAKKRFMIYKRRKVC